VIWLKAEPWENEYGGHRLPYNFDEYRFKVRVLKVHSDGAYDIKFDSCGSEQMVYPRYFRDTWCDNKEVKRRIELTANMLASFEIREGEEEEEEEEDEDEGSYISRGTKVQVSQSKVRGAPKNKNNSDVELEETRFQRSQRR